MKLISILRVIFALCVLTACTEREVIQENIYQGEKAVVRVNLNSNSTVSSGDDVIKTVRCIVFTDNNKLVSNELQVMSGAPYAMKGTVAYGHNHFYIVCNETPELTESLESVTSPSQLDDIRFTPPAAGIAAPLPMYSEVLDTYVTFKADGSDLEITVNGSTSDRLDVEMIRIVPKIDMMVIKNIPAGSTDFTIEEMSYRLCRVPKYSALKPGIAYPKSEQWGNDIESVGSGSIKASSNGTYVMSGDKYSTAPADLEAIHFPTVYTPEHLLEKQENVDYCTYMLIEAKCLFKNSSSVIHAKYKLELGHNPPTDYNLKRSVNYRIYATITSLGAAGFYAEIVPVDEYDLPITWEPFEGYAIVGERVEDYGSDMNIWNSYSQYSGILKVVKKRVYADALFRYGSVVALPASTFAGEFNDTTVLWRPDVAKSTPINSWDDIAYLASGDISETAHTLENIKAGKGDPCRLVGLSESEISAGTIDNKLWRMPTSTEMKWLETARNGTVDSRGLYSFSYLLTPFTGYRSSTGTLTPAGTEGRYWSATNANSLVFDNTNTPAIGTDDPKKAYAIRCIRTDIPESVFQIDGTIMSYLGGTASLAVNTSGTVVTPYWRMELEDPADGAVLSLSKGEGSIKESNIVTMKPAVNPYIKKEYNVKVTGYGLDGKVHEKTVIVTRKTLGHQVTISWTSEPTLPFIDGHYRIPQSGAKLLFEMKITPEPYLNIYPDFDNKEWRIQTQYYTDILNIEYGIPVVRNGVSEIVIKPNTWGHLLGLEFKMTPVLIGYPTYISESIVFIQEK